MKSASKKVSRAAVVFYLNGQRHEVSERQAGMMLSDYLRYDQGLTGTKVVCSEGDCGACSVLRRFPATEEKFLAINSCVTLVAQMDGSSLVTVDALKEENQLTPVQEAMMSCHGSQCGFCTPGFVMALTGLVEKKLAHGGKKITGKITEKEAKNATTGNLCRCTGYKSILDAAESIELKKCRSVEERYFSSLQEKDLKKVLAQPVFIQTEEFSFYAPLTLAEASGYLLKNPETKILAAGTDLGVFHNKWKKRYQSLLSLHLIPELYDLKISKGKVSVGARVTLSELRYGIENLIPEFARFLDIFASPQIKNVATLVGNVANASPIGDTPPFLLAAGAEVEISNGKKSRIVPLDEFYLGYRKIDLKKGELIKAIHFPVPKDEKSLAVYKSSQRKDLDISIVNMGVYLETDKKKRISEIRLGIGGVAATPLRLRKTESFLKGKEISSQVLEKATEILQSEITPISDLRGGQEYRRIVAENFLLRYFRERNLLPGELSSQVYFEQEAR